MPRSFSSWHGRRADPRLFNVPNDSDPNSFSGEGDERTHLDVDLETLVDTLLGPEDSAALSASKKMNGSAGVEAAAARAMSSAALPSPGCGLSLGQLTLQGGQTCSSSAIVRVEPRVECMGDDAAPTQRPMLSLPAGVPSLQASNNEYAEYHLQRIGELQKMAAGAASGGPPGAPPGGPIPMQRNESISSQMSNVSNVSDVSSQGQPPGNDQTPNFRWGGCRNLIATDAAGVLVRQPTMWPAVQLQVQLQLPLLYWAERRRWMWHKKWTLPKLHVLVSCDGKPVGGGYMFPGEPPVYAVVSAGTLRDGSEGEGGSLHDQGLGGECQRRLVAGETTFSSLLFRHTSFNCGNRPFHLVVTVLAPAHHPLAARPDVDSGLGRALPPRSSDKTPRAIGSAVREPAVRRETRSRT